MTVKSKARGGQQTTPAQNQRNLYIIGGIVIVAVLAVILVIAFSSQSRANTTRFADLPKSRTEDGAYVVGNPEAKVTIIEFADFTCSACLTYKPTMDQFIEQYVATGQAKFESRIIMTAGGQTTSYAARLADCAEQQREGAYWEAYEVLYDFGSRGPSNYNENMARPFADALDLNLAALLQCVPASERSGSDQRFAQGVGVNSTPTIMVRYGDSAPQLLPGGRDLQSLARAVEVGQVLP